MDTIESTTSALMPAVGKAHAINDNGNHKVFPDEILSIIIKYLATGSLLNLALVDKRHCKLVKAELFRDLDLGKRDADELTKLYKDLFSKTIIVSESEIHNHDYDHHDHDCLQAVQQSMGTLRDLHFQSISYQLVEEMAAEDEFAKRHSAALEIFNDIRGTASLELELGLTEESMSIFKSVFLHALAGTLEATKDRFGKIVVYIDAVGADSDEQSGWPSKMVNKVTHILRLLPVGLLTELHFNGVDLKTIPEPLKEILSSPTLEKLTLKESSIPLTGITTVPNLQKLVISWDTSRSKTVADLSTALQLLRASASTVKSLILQNIEGKDYSSATLAVPLDLPELQHVQLADSTLGPGSLLQVMLAHTRLPKLKVLDLETENIIDPGDDLSKILSLLPSLKRLKLNEGRLKKAPTETLDDTLFSRLRKGCAGSGVQLECTYSCLRCDIPSELEAEFSRIAILADTLTSISMASHPNAFKKFDNIPKVSLPLAHLITVGMTDFVSMSGDDDDDAQAWADRKPSIGGLLRRLNAPMLMGLQITMLMNDTAADTNLAEFYEVISSRLYPNLEYVSGVLMAAQGMSNETFKVHEASLLEACRKAGVEYNSLKFVSREHLLNGAEMSDEEDDEWVEDEDPDGESESSGESGYGESDGLLKAIKEEDDEDDPDDGDYEPRASEDGSDSSSTTDESWTSEEDHDM